MYSSNTSFSPSGRKEKKCTKKGIFFFFLLLFRGAFSGAFDADEPQRWGVEALKCLGRVGCQFRSINKLRPGRKVGSERKRCGRDAAGTADSFGACDGEDTDGRFLFIYLQALHVHVAGRGFGPRPHQNGWMDMNIFRIQGKLLV